MNNIVLLENKLTAEEFCNLEEAVGFGRPNISQSEIAIENSIPNTRVTVGLMAAKGKEEFYQKLGFRIRPNEKEGNGMMINIQI